MNRGRTVGIATACRLDSREVKLTTPNSDDMDLYPPPIRLHGVVLK
jgi:hypothetical protein